MSKPKLHGNTKDILGDVFGEYTVLSNEGKNKGRESLWKVRCSCGTEEILSRGSLTCGKQHCGCKPKDLTGTNAINFKDITGEVYGYLTAVEPVAGYRTGNRKWKMLCACGNEVVRTYNHNFGEGANNSCGCVKSGRHKMSHTKVYHVWHNMKRRCNEPSDKAYPDYGGRGIGYDPSWELFDNFWADMKEGYVAGLTLDRKKVNEGYSLDNCRWIPKARQCQGTRKRKDKWTSRFKGVALQESGKWLAQTQKDRVVERAGPFVSEEDAARAYDEMVLRLFGEFATTNLSLGLFDGR